MKVAITASDAFVAPYIIDATVISLDSFEKILDLSLSCLPFLCLMPAQCECPAIYYTLCCKEPPKIMGSTFLAKPVLSSATTIKPHRVASPVAGKC